MVSEAKKKRDAAKKIKAAAKVTGKSAQEVSDSISANTVCVYQQIYVGVANPTASMMYLITGCDICIYIAAVAMLMHTCASLWQRVQQPLCFL